MTREGGRRRRELGTSGLAVAHLGVLDFNNAICLSFVRGHRLCLTRGSYFVHS